MPRRYSPEYYVRGRASNRRGARTGVDPIAVERAAGGDRALRLTVAERRQAIDDLDALGEYSAADIARRLGCTRETVQRQRARRQAVA